MMFMPPPDHPPVPSKRELAITTLLALAAATFILVTVVLPAEYGIDPVGTGRALGLTRMSSPLDAVPEQAAVGPRGTLVPVQNGPIGIYPVAYRTDAVQFVLGPYEFVEYKYHLEQGATMLYAWKSTAVVIHDLHGDPAASPNAPVSFDKKPRRDATGSFTAPFTGIHGWYWENPAADTVTVTLTSAGFYSSATEFRSDRSKRTHEVNPPPGLSATGPK
jgi:hypothetical protein